MPDFDDTALNLALAGSRPAFDDAMDGGWPVALYDLIGALVQLQDGKSQGTSGSSNTIGTGSKTFTLSVPAAWPAGLPVYIMEDGTPGSNFMVGKLTAAATSEGVIEVNVTAAAGSGTFTQWTIAALFAVTTVASPPLAIADGGTGATTPSTARISLGLDTLREAVVRRNDPSGVQADKWHIVGPSGSGGWAGHDNEWVFYDGVSYTFEAPVAGDLALIAADVVDPGIFATTIRYAMRRWSGSSWELANPGSQKATTSFTTSLTILDTQLQTRMPVRIFKAGSGAVTWTLPLDFSIAGDVPVLVLANTSGSGDITVNVASAGTIDGGASITIAPGTVKTVAYVDTGKWFTL